MIEEEIVNLYKKTKKQLAALLDDMTFANFYRALQAGKRSYLLKNTLITKGIDSDWVNAIKACVPHLDAIVNNPRKYMKRETEVVPIEKARVVDNESVQHLAAHTNLINSVEDGMVKPKKILSAYNDESLELYENRFVATLITRVSQFIDRRYFLLGAGGREFCATVKADGNFEQAGEETNYSLSMTVKQGADYFDGGVSNKVYEDLFLIRKYANSFKYSPFMKIMNTVGQVRAPIVKTNLLSKDPHYRACVQLWDFIEAYNKAGYKIEVEESAPRFSAELIDDFDAINMIQYIALKKKMGDFDPRRRAMTSCDKKVIKPTIEEYQSTKKEDIGMGIGGGSFEQGHSRKQSDAGNEEVIKDVLLRALRKEAVKHELADKQLAERERVMQKALDDAMNIKLEREKQQQQRAKDLEKTIKSAISEENARAKKQELDARRAAQPSMRALRRSLNRIENNQEANLAAQRQEERDNDQLMKAVLGDLLRIEEEREYFRASPLIIDGGENMPVPVFEQNLPATTDVYNHYTQMFTPPLRVEPQDWDDLKDELKHKRVRHSAQDIQKALIDALKLEQKRLRKQKLAETKAEQAELEQQELQKRLAKMQQHAENELPDSNAGSGGNGGSDKDKQSHDTKQPAGSNNGGQDNNASGKDNNNASGNNNNNASGKDNNVSGNNNSGGGGHGAGEQDERKHTSAETEEELNFWQRIIKVIKSWFVK